MDTICVYCGSDEMEFMGMDDGGGDYGDAICEQWDCLNCGASMEIHCMEYPEEPTRDDDHPLPPIQIDIDRW